MPQSSLLINLNDGQVPPSLVSALIDEHAPLANVLAMRLMHQDPLPLPFAFDTKNIVQSVSFAFAFAETLAIQAVQALQEGRFTQDVLSALRVGWAWLPDMFLQDAQDVLRHHLKKASFEKSVENYIENEAQEIQAILQGNPLPNRDMVTYQKGGSITDSLSPEEVRQVKEPMTLEYFKEAHQAAQQTLVEGAAPVVEEPVSIIKTMALVDHRVNQAVDQGLRVQEFEQAIGSWMENWTSGIDDRLERLSVSYGMAALRIRLAAYKPRSFGLQGDGGDFKRVNQYGPLDKMILPDIDVSIKHRIVELFSQQANLLPGRGRDEVVRWIIDNLADGHEIDDSGPTLMRKMYGGVLGGSEQYRRARAKTLTQIIDAEESRLLQADLLKAAEPTAEASVLRRATAPRA